MIAKEGAKCTCNLGWAVLGWILMAVGLWVLVAGFATQFTSKEPAAVNAAVLGWYFAGFVIFGISKIVKWKSHGKCPVHVNVN